MYSGWGMGGNLRSLDGWGNNNGDIEDGNVMYA